MIISSQQLFEEFDEYESKSLDSIAVRSYGIPNPEDYSRYQLIDAMVSIEIENSLK